MITRSNEPRFDPTKWFSNNKSTPRNTFNKEGKISNYVINGQIGQGAYAIVKQGYNKKTEQRVAIKIYEKLKISDTQRKTSVNREISLLKRLNHPYIVKLHEVIETTQQLYLVMELLKGKSLVKDVRNKLNKKLLEKKC